MKADDSKRNRTTFLVLLALSHGAMHGYEISKFIDDRSKGFFAMPFGSLYPVLHKLEKEKLISATWEPKNSLKPRKVYALSTKGRSVLNEEVEGFEQYTHAIALMMPKGL